MNQLIKIKFLFLYCFISGLSLTYGQVNPNFFSPTSFYMITSEDGYQKLERSTVFQFHMQYNGYSVPKWSLSVQLDKDRGGVTINGGGPNKSGKLFPLNMITLTWDMVNHSLIDPKNIGLNSGQIFLNEGNEIFLITNSRDTLKPPGIPYIQNHFRVQPGAYLHDYTTATTGGDGKHYAHVNYSIPLKYTLYDEHKNILGNPITIVYNVQLLPYLAKGTAVPDYNLEIGAEASNAVLSFFSTRDYKEGVDLFLKDAIKVNSITDFELRVKAVDSEFTRAGGGSLPVSILNTHLTMGSGASPVLSNPYVQLSDKDQLLLSGSSVDKSIAQFFNLNYRAKLTPEQVTTVTTGEYSLSISYQLLPR